MVHALERHNVQHKIMHENQGGFKQKAGAIENVYISKTCSTVTDTYAAPSQTFKVRTIPSGGKQY